MKNYGLSGAAVIALHNKFGESTIHPGSKDGRAWPLIIKSKDAYNFMRRNHRKTLEPDYDIIKSSIDKMIELTLWEPK